MVYSDDPDFAGSQNLNDEFTQDTDAPDDEIEDDEDFSGDPDDADLDEDSLE